MPAQGNALSKGRGVPDWEEDLRRCVEKHKMHAIRVYTNYHEYELSDERFHRLFELATRSGLIVQVAVMMEEERTQHPLVKVPHVNTAPLVELMNQYPKARVILQNCFRAVRGGLLLKLIATERAWFDTSTVEGMAGIGKFLKQIPINRLILGTHAPFYIPLSSILTLRESDLTLEQTNAIRFGNASALAREQ